jgi:hypothetical protein
MTLYFHFDKPIINAPEQYSAFSLSVLYLTQYTFSDRHPSQSGTDCKRPRLTISARSLGPETSGKCPGITNFFSRKQEPDDRSRVFPSFISVMPLLASRTVKSTHTPFLDTNVPRHPCHNYQLTWLSH